MDVEIWTADFVNLGDGLRASWGILVDGKRVVNAAAVDELRGRYPQLPLVNKGKYLGIPFVNAHTHLDLSNFETFHGDFADFIKFVVAGREKRGLEAVRAVADSIPQNTLGDIVANDERVMDWWLRESPYDGVAYWEVLGVYPPAKEEEYLKRTKELLLRWKTLQRSSGPRLGVSPHSPYSLTPSLMRSIVEFSTAEGLPLQIHAAESPAEREYFLRRRGPLLEFFESLGLPKDIHPVGLTPIAYLSQAGALRSGASLVHGVQVDETDVSIIADSGVTVISCPRSNLNLNAGLPPYHLYLQSGVMLALGSDSLASAETLNVKDDIAALEDAGVPLRNALQAASSNGYAALGLTSPRIVAGTDAKLVEFL